METTLVAARARATNAKISSCFDRAFRDNPAAVRNLGAKVAPECTEVPIVSTQTPADYRAGRRLMAQTLIAYAIVAAAAGWAAWSLFLRGWLRRRAKPACGDDCACGD